MACEWVASCLVKAPTGRATYGELLDHEFIQRDELKAHAAGGDALDVAAWVRTALKFREAKLAHSQALAAASLGPTRPIGHHVLSAPVVVRSGVD